MPLSLTSAAIQMDGAPASLSERLERAEALIQQAVQTDAKLIVLPAFFNTGATYLETNYERTEPVDGATFQWVCQQAKTHQVYIAGSWLIVDHDESYHAACLAAPDGESWHYDQQHPFLWERVFYRDGGRLTIAETDLGKIGFMIGWDVAHAACWERYAAHVDLLLIFTGQPDWSQLQLAFPDGTAYPLAFPFNWLANKIHRAQQQAITQGTHWLDVPAVCSGLSGEFRSILPAPRFSIGALTSTQPDLWEQVKAHHAEVELVAPFAAMTGIYRRSKNRSEFPVGERHASPLQHGSQDSRTFSETAYNNDGTITAPEQGDSIAIATITLPDTTPLPHAGQPEIKMPAFVYRLVDMFIAGLFTLNYQRGLRRQWGARMAPANPDTRRWWIVVGLAAVIGWLLGLRIKNGNVKSRKN